jgi:cytochrome c556
MRSAALRSAIVAASVASLLLATGARAEETPWDQERVAALAAALHESVKGMRDELRAVRPTIASMDAWAYHRLVDDLRLIERETQYLHQALASGEGRDETRPAYARLATLRRSCDEEMRRQALRRPMLERIAAARAIVKQMDPYYGFDPERDDHERVLQR